MSSTKSSKNQENSDNTTAGSKMLLINRVEASTEAQGSGDNEWVMSCAHGDNI